jgi:hypothetical protein
MSKKFRKELPKHSMISTTKALLPRIFSYSSKSMKPRRTARSGKERLRGSREIMMLSRKSLIRRLRKSFNRYSSQRWGLSRLEKSLRSK